MTVEFREDLLKVIDFSGVLPESPYPQIGELIDPQTCSNIWYIDGLKDVY